MPEPSVEPIPQLSDSCVPPTVLGMATLTTAAMHGAAPDVLAAMIERHDADPAARLFDTGIARQLAFRGAEGQDLQDEALRLAAVFRIRRETIEPPLRLLAVLAPGALMANTPLDFITNHLDVRLDLLFVRPGQPLPPAIPEHDVAFFAAGDADAATLVRLQALFAAWPRPALNDPNHLDLLARDRLSVLLAGAPGIASPPAVAVTRLHLHRWLADGGDIGGLLPGCAYPVLARARGSHAGRGLKKIDGPAEFAAYLLFSFDPEYYVTAFTEYRSSDGLYRKYRVAFIDGEPFLCHMACSGNWMVHYLNAGMTDSAAKRADEAQAMASFPAGFAKRHRDAFAALHARLPFDYYSIDCGETHDGSLLVFEADTAAIIHLMDPVALFPYKHEHMRHAFAAFEAMLWRHVRSGSALAATRAAGVTAGAPAVRSPAAAGRNSTADSGSGRRL